MYEGFKSGWMEGDQEMRLIVTEEVSPSETAWCWRVEQLCTGQRIMGSVLL